MITAVLKGIAQFGIVCAGPPIKGTALMSGGHHSLMDTNN